MLAFETPYPKIIDLSDGSPLDAGFVYIGAVNQNPETNPVTVYWDAAGTQPAAQPLRTLNGLIARNGTPAQIFCGTDYSLTTRDKRGRFNYYAANSADFSLASAISAIYTNLADTTDATKNSGSVGFNFTLNYAAGTVGREFLNDPISPYQFPWLVKGDGTTDDSAAIQACVNFAKGHPILFEERTHILGTSIECNDQTATGAYRPGAKILGQGIGKTIFINRSGGPAFKCTLTQSQGDNSYFARGTRFQGFDVIADGSSAASSRGIALQGQYFPVISDVRLYGLLGDAIEVLADARWTNTDLYSNGELTVERCVISGNSGWGIESIAYSNSWHIIDTYTTANTKGGYYLAGTGHIVEGGAVAGNGAAADSASGGIVLGRTVAGSSQITTIFGVELDSNYNRQVWMQSQLAKLERCRVIDDATGGSFHAANQVEIGGITGDTFDDNLIDQCYFRLANVGAANTTLARVRLPVTDGTQTARYNELRNPLISIAGATTGVVTPFSVENSTSTYAQGNTYRANGQLKFSSSAVGSTEKASAVAYLGTSMAIPVTPTAAAVVTADTVAIDTHSAYDTANKQFICPYSGILDVDMQLGIFSGAANVGVTFGIQRDPGSGYVTYTSITCRDGNAQSFSAHMAIVVAAGDKVRVNAQQAATGTAQIGSGLASLISYRMR